MLHNTQGIVLKQVKYGDTSLIVSIFTELFGLQQYLLQGVRTEKKSGMKANLFQVSTILELVVYHQTNRKLHRIKEAKISYWYHLVPTDMKRSSIAIFCLEVFSKIIVEPETNIELYSFIEKSLKTVDTADERYLPNFPLYYLLQFVEILGFGIQGMYSDERKVLDLVNGQYIPRTSDNLSSNYIDDWRSDKIGLLLLANEQTIELNSMQRVELLQLLLTYLKIHISNMSAVKSVDVLHELFK